ncbi:hypothetical protein WN55_09870 [Dufourea novaeangliae]|uniref:Uncharacterized protein n=1 Tax=Dufourea novaeangliae TaxID=178035 RepID=A0A154P7Q9_DUFNO|nr:hypothetical protein WN55_09870 [Dufourea novaeangliae]
MYLELKGLVLVFSNPPWRTVQSPGTTRKCFQILHFYKIIFFVKNMAKRQSRRTTVRDNEFESDDSDCLDDIEEQFQRVYASEMESSEESEDLFTFR